jgi:cytochrome P450
MNAPAAFDLLNPAIRANPYPTYHALRTHDPLFFADPPGFWLVTGYAEINTLLRSNRLGRDPRRLGEEAPQVHEVFREEGAQDILFLDPPDHTRLRRLVSHAFTPRRIEQMRPRIAAEVDRLLDEAADAGGMDVIAHVSNALPIRTISQLLGVPLEDSAQFREWSTDISLLLDPIGSFEAADRGIRARQHFRDYFRGHLRHVAESDEDNLLKAMVEARESDDRLSEPELLSMSTLLLVAGHETTSGLIGNGVLTLLRNPDQLRMLADRPDLIDPTIEEFLRYETPVQLTSRVVLEPVELPDHTLEAGQQAVLILGAGNRDPRRFAEPDRFDITRSDNQHLAFGGGIHYCLGASLARIQAQEFFKKLTQRFPDAALVGEPRWREAFTLRGLESLSITL